MSKTFRIETLGPTDDWSSVRAFWYRVYVQEMGKKIDYANHSLKALGDDGLCNGYVHCAYLDDQLVATLRRNSVSDLEDSSCQWNDFRLAALSQELDFDKVSYSSKLVVDSDYRSSTVMARLVNYAYLHACESGVEIDVLYCMPRLAALYKRLGFRKIPGFRHQTGVGALVPMVLLINDIEYLKRIKSPFCRQHQGAVVSEEVKAIFAKTYGDASDESDCPVARVAPLADLFNEQWNSTNELPVNLSLSANCLSKLGAFGEEFLAPSGSVISGLGEPSTHLFIVLSGSVEVEAVVRGKNSTVAVLGPGQIFGETSVSTPFVSRETVRALSDSKILALSSAALCRGIEGNLEAQVLLLLVRGMMVRGWLFKKKVEEYYGEFA